MEQSALTAASRVANPAGPTVRCERLIASDAATIWKALLDAEDTAFWFAEVQCEPRAGAPICVTWDDGDCAFGEIVTCEPEACLAYTWSWQGIGNVSLVTWRLTPAEGGVTVTLTHQLADDFDRAEYAAGWKYFLGRLADLCEGEAVPQRKLSEPPGAVDMAIDLPASPTRVWAMLTDDSQVGRWFSRCHLEPWLGGTVAFFAARTGRLLDRGTITAFEPNTRLAFTWTEPGWPADTVVEWTLAAIPGGTRLSVSHGGWNHLPLALARGDRPGKTAWRVALADLRALLSAEDKAPSDGFRLTRVLQGPAEASWRLLTSVAAMRRWIGMPDDDTATIAYEAVLGGEVRIEDASGDALIGRVTAFEPGHRLVWTVRAGGIAPESTYTFELTPDAPGYLFGARVTCTGRGFELEHDRAAAERRAAVWLLQLQELAHGEEPARVERRAPEPIVLTVDLAVPTTRVFAMLTRDEELARWLCDASEFGAGMGGAFEWTSRTADDRVVVDRGRVVEFRPGERLAVACVRDGAGWGAPVVFSFDLRPLKGGTRLRMEASGWDALPLTLRDTERSLAALRWRRALGLLRDLVREEAAQHEHVMARRAAKSEEFVSESPAAPPRPVGPRRDRPAEEVRLGADVPSRLPYRVEEDEEAPDSVKARRSAVGHARAARPRDRDFDSFDERPRPVKKAAKPKPKGPVVDRGTRGIARDPSRLWKEKPAEKPVKAAAPSRGGSARPSSGGRPAPAGRPASGGRPAPGGRPSNGPRPRPASGGRDGAYGSRDRDYAPRGSGGPSRGGAPSRSGPPSRGSGPVRTGSAPQRPTSRGSAIPRGSENMARGAYSQRPSAPAPRGGSASGPGRPAARPSGGKKPVNRGGPRPATPRNTRAGATIGGRGPKPPKRGGR